MDYKARFYSQRLGRFIQPDSIVPGVENSQSWNRYSYGLNNPSRYTDPTGHKVCEDVDANGKCTGDKLARLLDYVHDKIVNDKGAAKKQYTSLEAMNLVVKKAAYIYGKDWNGFMDATNFIFLGVYGHGSGTLWAARRYTGDFNGYDFSDTGFHEDFQQFGDNQVRHFWASFATAVRTENVGYGGPYGSIAEASGTFVAHWGNTWHDVIEDRIGHPDTTISDFTLSITAINLAQNVRTDTIASPADLPYALETTLSAGSNGMNQMWQWLFVTPYD